MQASEPHKKAKKTKFNNAHMILTFLFLVFIFLFGTINAIAQFPELVRLFRESEDKNTGETYATIGTSYNNNFANRLSFIDLHGGIQKILGKHEVGNFDVVSDVDGNLFYSLNLGDPTFRPLDLITKDDIVELTLAKNYCEQNGTKFLYILPQMSTVEGVTEYPSGIVCNQNENLDRRVEVMRSAGIDVLDIRTSVENSELDRTELFYRTDHHWRTETAFFAYQEVMEYLRSQYQMEFSNFSQITDLNQFEQRIYPNDFLGSLGRRVGRLYAGKDDFNLIFPKFQTEYTYLNSHDNKEPIAGTFYNTLIDESKLQPDPTNQVNRYAAYLRSDQAERTIINQNGEYKALVVQSSYGLPLTSFLSLGFAETTVLDFRHYKDKDFKEYLESHKGAYDVVLLIAQFERAYLFPSAGEIVDPRNVS